MTDKRVTINDLYMAQPGEEKNLAREARIADDSKHGAEMYVIREIYRVIDETGGLSLTDDLIAAVNNMDYWRKRHTQAYEAFFKTED